MQNNCTSVKLSEEELLLLVEAARTSGRLCACSSHACNGTTGSTTAAVLGFSTAF